MKNLGNLTVPVLAVDPGNPSSGDVYFNSTDSKFYGYNGAAWVVISAISAGDLPSHFHDDRYYTESETDALLNSKANKAGDTFEGKVVLPASLTGAASLNVPHGVAPTVLDNGDIWTTTAALYVRLNGTTRTMAHTASWSTVTQAEAESGIATSERFWTAQRVKQAITANAMPKGPITWDQLKGV